MKRMRLPGWKWLRGLRNLPLRVGVLAGIYLSVVFIVWLFAANRLPFLEPFAEVRNWVAVGVFALVMLVPVAYFLRRPAQMIASGMAAWIVFSFCYAVMGLFFENLHSRLRSVFQVFFFGALLYAIVAVSAWVAALALEIRHQPAVASRRRRP